MTPITSGQRFNRTLGADTQQKDAASRRVLRAGQLRRYAALLPRV